MGDEHRQLALFSARLETICETIALLRMECSCRPSELGTGCRGGRGQHRSMWAPLPFGRFS